jgi:hypothetical protein
MVIRKISAIIPIKAWAVEQFRLLDEVKFRTKRFELPDTDVVMPPAKRYGQRANDSVCRSLPGLHIPRDHNSDGMSENRESWGQSAQNVRQATAPGPRIRFGRDNKNAWQGHVCSMVNYESSFNC